jgi:hypothetical protein
VPSGARRSLNEALFDGHYIDVCPDGEVSVGSIRFKPEFEALIRFTEGFVGRVEPRVSQAQATCWRLPPRRELRRRVAVRPSGGGRIMFWRTVETKLSRPSTLPWF